MVVGSWGRRYLPKVGNRNQEDVSGSAARVRRCQRERSPSLCARAAASTLLAVPLLRSRFVTCTLTVLSPSAVIRAVVKRKWRAWSAGKLQRDRHRLERQQWLDVGIDALAGGANGIHTTQESFG